MSGKRKKDDSEAVGIMKFFKSTERNRISSKEPSDIAETLLLIIILGFS